MEGKLVGRIGYTSTAHSSTDSINEIPACRERLNKKRFQPAFLISRFLSPTIQSICSLFTRRFNWLIRRRYSRLSRNGILSFHFHHVYPHVAPWKTRALVPLLSPVRRSTLPLSDNRISRTSLSTVSRSHCKKVRVPKINRGSEIAVDPEPWIYESTAMNLPRKLYGWGIASSRSG